MTADRRPSYATIQALRGIAASMVVLFHLLPFEQKYLGDPTVIPDLFEIGHAGVDIFFVISGFIVTTISAGEFAHTRDSLRFLIRRCWRIYPTYWVYFAMLLIVYALSPGLMNHNGPQSPWLLDSFLLLPSGSPPLLLVAWTLTFELYFYLVFACLLRLGHRIGLTRAVAGWAIVLVGGRLLLPTRQVPILDLVFNPLNLEFMAGCGIALLVRRYPRRLGFVAVAIGLPAGVLMLYALGVPIAFHNIWARVAIFGSLAALIVAGCVGLEVPGVSRVPALLTRIGDSSYSLYLSHLLTIGAVGEVMQYMTDRKLVNPHDVTVHGGALAGAFVASLIVGWVGYRLIEAPLIRLTMRSSHRAAPAPQLATASAGSERVGASAGQTSGR